VKLQEYALMAEIVGSIAIVLSLGFVGFEVHQNNQTNIQTATQAVVSVHIESMRLLSRDRELACIYSRGVQDYKSLRGSERVRLSGFFLAIYYGIQEMWTLFEQGAMEPDVWSGFESQAHEITSLPGFRQWYATRRQWFGGAFQAYLDGIFEEPQAFDPVIYDDPACQ